MPDPSTPLSENKGSESEELTRLRAELEAARTAEIWYHETIGAADLGTWSWELTTGELSWSDRCRALFGLPAGKHVDYSTFLTLLEPEDRDRVDAAVRHAVETGEPYDAFSRVRWPDGSVHWLRFKGRSRGTSFQGVVIDVQTQKQTEEQLRAALAREKESHERAQAAEAEARTVLESMAEGFYGLDAEYRFTYVNAAGERILGRTRDQLLGQSIFELFPESLGTELEMRYRDTMETRAPSEFELHFEPWNRWFMVKVYPSARSGLAVYFRDITRQRQMEIALLDSQERFEMINNYIPVMVWTTRPDGYHDYFNRRWTEYTGLTPEQSMGRAWASVVHPDDRERSVARWEQSLKTGEPYEVEYRFRKGSDDTYHWFLAQALPVRDRNGRIVRWFGTCTDIQDRKLAEADLAAARQAAEEASQAKSQFLASMSHELRTPLNAIIGYSEMLQEEVTELGADHLAPDLKRIHTAGKHLLSLISDILDLSKIEAGKMDVFAERFDVASTVQEIAGTVDGLITRGGNRLEVRVAENAGRMNSDVTKVRQSLFNLLSNAAKFTKEGTITLEALPDPAAPNTHVLFRVVDTGPGIPVEKFPALFEPFAQVHGKTSARTGTGLGLAITQRFCHLLGGDISVESEVGRGSTFTIRLPREYAGAATRAPEGGEAPGTTEHAGSPPAESRGKGLVLVIDDDPNARDIMQRYLTREGFRTVLAASGEEGIRLAREVRPDVITLDVMMPGMDGWSVLQALKADSSIECIPVVMVTMIGDRSLAFALGAADFMEKPVTRDKLGGILRKFRCHKPPCRVLLVEDDEDSRRLVGSLFEKEGWIVDTAANGIEGLVAVQANKPALIVLDLAMPEMDGFEFAVELRRRPDFRQLPIVVLTARDLTAEDRRRLNGNVEKVLSKGAMSNEEMLFEVREILNSCR